LVDLPGLCIDPAKEPRPADLRFDLRARLRRLRLHLQDADGRRVRIARCQLLPLAGETPPFATATGCLRLWTGRERLDLLVSGPGRRPRICRNVQDGDRIVLAAAIDTALERAAIGLPGGMTLRPVLRLLRPRDREWNGLLDRLHAATPTVLEGAPGGAGAASTLVPVAIPGRYRLGWYFTSSTVREWLHGPEELEVELDGSGAPVALPPPDPQALAAAIAATRRNH
jgi:hypothetical protein